VPTVNGMTSQLVASQLMTCSAYTFVSFPPALAGFTLVACEV